MSTGQIWGFKGDGHVFFCFLDKGPRLFCLKFHSSKNHVLPVTATLTTGRKGKREPCPFLSVQIGVTEKTVEATPFPWTQPGRMRKYIPFLATLHPSHPSFSSCESKLAAANVCDPWSYISWGTTSPCYPQVPYNHLHSTYGSSKNVYTSKPPNNKSIQPETACWGSRGLVP